MDKLSVAELYQNMSKIGMNGWIDDSEGEVLREEIEKLKPGQTYLEVGVAYGKSLSTMCYYANPEVNIYGIDRLNWSQRDENMGKLGLDPKRAIFIEGDSQQEALDWEKNNKPLIDLLFIDADHTYYGVAKDLLSWLPLVKPGGRIMMHDYDQTSPGVMRAIHDFIFTHPSYTNFTEPHPDSVTIYRFSKK